ncbi:MAG: HEAT repeat domain-containing protein [Candidatus Brocadiia bacterium]
MARRRFKPDASFFRKIAIGAIGTRAVQEDLAQYGYSIVELERGATETKIWKDVKRKRVRIPDLVCLTSGIRIEVRAKTSPTLQMSHSPEEAERAWDYGLVDSDWLAFPVCVPLGEKDWSEGDLAGTASYFRQRRWERFEQTGKINYFTVGEFRRVRHARGRRKGVVEASEYSVEWDAVFSTRTGPVRYVDADDATGEHLVSIENSEGRAYTWRVKAALDVLVEANQRVQQNEVVAAGVGPIRAERERPEALTSAGLRRRFLESHERTMRFTGVKLARLRQDAAHMGMVEELANDRDEDLYVRLEALSYLCAVAGAPVMEAFRPYLDSGVDEDALEAVICIGEVGNESAIDALDALLKHTTTPYFLRSASAWALGRIPHQKAQRALIRAFADQTLAIKEEALRALVSLGHEAVPDLINGLGSADPAVAAGCAEALRRCRDLSEPHLRRVLQKLRGDQPCSWSVWLIGNLPRDLTATRIAAMQEVDERVHYGLSLLWSFSRSWISEHWEKYPGAARGDMEG